MMYMQVQRACWIPPTCLSAGGCDDSHRVLRNTNLNRLTQYKFKQAYLLTSFHNEKESIYQDMVTLS